MTTFAYLCKVNERLISSFTNPSELGRAKRSQQTMMYDDLMIQIEQIAVENPEGFTLRTASLEMVTTGIAVGHKETQNAFGRGGLHHCIHHSLYNYGVIGGWKNPDGQMQYDSIRIFTDLRKAVKWGRKQGQIAIFDIDNGWEIIL